MPLTESDIYRNRNPVGRNRLSETPGANLTFFVNLIRIINSLIHSVVLRIHDDQILPGTTLRLSLRTCLTKSAGES